ncbi:MAG TPA: ABC transporter permease [Firmicutes bacterium]|nr:ABC transporter permease [Candidatus Fermentithermobacillaceae bacterium]
MDNTSQQQKRSLWIDVWARFKKNRLAMIGLCVIIFLYLVALFAPVLAPYPYDKMNLTNLYASPGSPGHILGTDEFGRDVLSRLIYGARISLTVGLVVVGMASAIGVTLGALAGYYGGWVDSLIMRIVDFLYAFPFFILAITIVAILGPSLYNAMFALALVSWIGYARMVRGQFLALKQREFVEAAKAVGASGFRIMFVHLLPNALGPVIVQMSLGVAGAILSASGLSFLGLGAQPPTAEWGAMLNAGKDYIRSAPHLATYPGLAIMITVLAFNFVGDGLRDALDPKLKQ